MSRVKGGVASHARHRKVVKAAKGYYGARSRNFRTATQAVDKANQYATRDRKNRKRNTFTAPKLRRRCRLARTILLWSSLFPNPHDLHRRTAQTALQKNEKEPALQKKQPPAFRSSCPFRSWRLSCKTAPAPLSMNPSATTFCVCSPQRQTSTRAVKPPKSSSTTPPN